MRLGVYAVGVAHIGWVWPIGIAVLVIAGFAAALLPRRRQRLEASRTAWSSARTAIETAGISRDAAPVAVPEAEQLLLQAELIAARRGEAAAAQSAADHARRADRLWRAASHG
jgi:hypothetical protein